ncbi:DNA repair protein RadC [candidate division WOR-3 bacterium]|nr:DNA repair protein RadC [candidate division WOR-3 bacterium]
MGDAKRAFTVHDLPARERPRERLVREGAHALSSAEVLAIVISRGTRGLSVLDIARDLIHRYRTIAAIADAPVEELVQVPGIGPAKACQLKAALELARRREEPADDDAGTDLSSAEAVARLMRSRFSHPNKECFYVLVVDARNRLIGREDVSQGSLNSTMAHPREVFEKAIRAHGAGIIVVHNHPSGDPQPSDDDIRLTRRLAEAGKVVGIPLHDHVIVSRDSHYSFRRRALL